MSEVSPGSPFSVLLFSERGIDRHHQEEVAGWFRRISGPIKVNVVSKPVDLSLTDDRFLLWDTAFSKLNQLREECEASAEQFICLLTKSPNEKGWYAVQDEKHLRNSFVHVGDFSWVTTAPASVITTHYLLKEIFNALVAEGSVHWEKLSHKQSRGCFYDFCEQKWELSLKLRTADICGDCMQVFRSIGIPDALIQQAVGIMEGSRRLALNTGQYLKSEAVFDRWPFPVAVTRHKAVQATRPLLRFLLLLDHFDSLVRYFYLTKEILTGRKPSVVERPSMGWWLDQLGQSLKGETHFREVVRIAQQEKVVTLRNERRGHGWMSATEESYRDDAVRIENVLTKIEDELAPFLETHHLVIPREIRLINDRYTIEGDHLIGSHTLHPPFSVCLKVEPRSVGIVSQDDVYVSDAQMSKFWKISPYISCAICPVCRHPRILVTDGGNQFIDVFMGHRVELTL